MKNYPLENAKNRLYLTHPIALRVVQKVLPTRDPVFQLVAFAVLTLAASLALRYGVEVPFLNWRDRSQRAPRGHGRHAVAPSPGENRSTQDMPSPNPPEAVSC
jgi:peptidoglycan/LPS O-acetylase OafA/YrhL